mmetsp:Transcript_83384/g.232550  ORF Transcript_83384/g.232550 Transcript_83384/m.232550 type:complete len:201 (+) Transcript_83384:1592-2194(+)
MDSVGSALSIGAVLTAMICAFGPVSGGHFNPAVTVAMIISRRCEAKTMLYVLAQLAGGLVAGAIFTLICGSTFAIEPVGRYHWQAAGVLEALYTSALCYVVLAVTGTASKGSHVPGIAIGFTVMASTFTIGGISGCSLNPAIQLGAAAANTHLVGLKAAFSYTPVYIAASLSGSFLGVVLHAVVFPPQDDNKNDGAAATC